MYINPDYKLADPICTFLFSILVFTTTIPVIKDCIAILMEAVPKGINLKEFSQKIAKIPGVVEVHDIHIWLLSVGKPAMSGHIIADD
jgi:zinc transporter 2